MHDGEEKCENSAIQTEDSVTQKFVSAYVKLRDLKREKNTELLCDVDIPRQEVKAGQFRQK